MRVRIRTSAHYEDAWVVETKKWWYLTWDHAESFYGDTAYEKAKKAAFRLKYQAIEEIE
jgi:hypothetical protein